MKDSLSNRATDELVSDFIKAAEARQEALEASRDRIQQKMDETFYRKDSDFHQDAGKPPLSLISAEALRAEAQVMAYGANKYGRFNWRDHADSWEYSQLIDSTLRHIYDWLQGEDLDAESGLDALAHARANLGMLIDLRCMGKGKDDRWGAWRVGSPEVPDEEK